MQKTGRIRIYQNRVLTSIRYVSNNVYVMCDVGCRSSIIGTKQGQNASLSLKVFWQSMS